MPHQSIPTSSCAETVELLPWLLNGSLEADERRTVKEHLAACASCRDEFAMSMEIWQITTSHIPSLALAEYAQGLEPSTLGRSQIERHLAHCAMCREELEWAMYEPKPVAAPVLDFAAARNRAAALPSAPPASRRLAIAAGVAATLLTGGLIIERLGLTSHDAPQLAHSGRLPVSTHAGSVPQNSDQAVVFSDAFESGTIQAWHSDESAGGP